MRKKAVLTMAAMLAMAAGLFMGCEASVDQNPKDKRAEYENCTAEISSAALIPNYEGSQAIRIAFSFQNNGADAQYLLESFDIRAYQDDTELEYVSLNDQSEQAQNTIKAVKDGGQVECVMVFSMIQEGPVEVKICTPTADQKQLAQVVFSQNG